MSVISRLKRLWELSGTLSEADDEKLAEEIRQDGYFYRKSKQKERIKKGQRLATVLADTDPFEGIPTEEEKDNDSTNKQPSDS
jgi:hypothetical protein